MNNLLEKYGGFPVITIIISDFYDRVLNNQRLASFFKNTNMAKLVDHQTRLVSSLMSDNNVVFDSDAILRTKHRHLNITEADFDLIIKIMSDTLANNGIMPEDIAPIIGKLYEKKPLIVS